MFQKYITNASLNKIDVNIFNVLVSLLIAPIFAGLFPKLLNFEQNYNEFTVGTITFLGVSKNIDYLIILGFAFGFVLAYLFLNKIIDSINNEEYARFKEQSLIVSIPAIIWLGGLIFSKELNTTLLVLSSTLQLYLVISYFIKLRDKDFVSYSLLATSFTVFSIFAWAIFVNRVFDIGVPWLLKLANPYLSTKFIIAIGLFLFIYSFLFHKLPNYKNQLLVLTQLSLPLLFLFLIPQKVLDGNQLISLYPATSFLYYAVTFVVLFSIGLIGKKMFESTKSITENISSVSLIAILFFAKAYLIVIPSVSSDDYHFGEFLLPFWSWLEYGQLPFQDIVPARGLINYLDGFLVYIFFEMKASYFQLMQNFLLLFYVSILFIVLRKYFNIYFAFLLVLIFPPWLGVSGIDIFNTTLLVFLAHLFIAKQYYKFLAFSLLLVTMSILFAPGQGGILALSITPLGLYALYRIMSHDYKIAWRFLAFLLIPYILIVALTPLFDMLYGAILYAKEQSSLNSITYGTPWYFSVNSFANGNYWLFEIVRSGYVAIIGFSFIVLIKYLSNKELLNRREVLVYASIVLVTSLLFIIRGAGRIDPGIFSRLGIATTFIIGILLPILIYHLLPKYNSMVAMAFIVFYISTFGYVGNSMSLNQLIAKVSSKTHLPQNFLYIKDTNIENMGNGVFDDSHIKRVVKIKNFLETVLDKNETFLNLTNRNALYFYLNRKPPIETGAFYNLVSQGQQKRAIEKLVRNTPKVAILEASNITHDQVKLPLRSPLLYRFVVQNYQPIEIDGIVYGIRNDIFEKFKTQVSEQEQQNLYDRSFLTSHLQFVPSEWGNNFEKLRKKLAIVEKLNIVSNVNHLNKIDNGYEIAGKDPFIVYDIDKNISGAKAGYLSFQFSCMEDVKEIGFMNADFSGVNKSNRSIAKLTKSINHFEIYFKGDNLEFNENMVLRFDSANSQNLVPLESSHRYLQLRNLDSIRIDIASNSSCKKFQISSVALLQKKDIKQFALDKKVQLLGTKEHKLRPFPLSDENWINGISKDNTTFFITNEDYVYFKLETNQTLDIETLGKIKILKVIPTGEYVRIKFTTIGN